MRDKLIAHRVEAGTAKAVNFTKWYAEKYGSIESVFELINQIKGLMLNKVLELEEANLLIATSRGTVGDRELCESDILKLLAALKKCGIY